MANNRIEIPIPPPDRQNDPKFAFTKRPDGMISVEAETTQDHIAAFRNVAEELDEHYWAQAAVAASMSVKYGNSEYGRGEMGKLADAVELSVNYLNKMARTYRTFSQFVPRDTNRSFKHHMIACRHPNPGKALTYSRERGLSCDTFDKWVSGEMLKRAKKATRKAQEAARTQFLDHLEHVEAIIEDDFIKNCPIKDFARRVYEKGWLSEIKYELRQHLRKTNQAIVRGAIDEEGAGTLQQIRDITTLSLSEVESTVAQMVADGEYKWVPRGRAGDEDNQHGPTSLMLTKAS